MSRLLREPLLHFLLLGAVLFALYGWLNRNAKGGAPGEIVVSRSQLDSLRSQFQQNWQRAPTTEELNGLVETWIREEILYREGLAMGLDRDDPLVRRRIVQKMEFAAEGQGPVLPTDGELQTWLDAHVDNYRVDPKYSLRQVYFDPARHGDRIDADIAAARAALARGLSVTGDSTMLPERMDAATAFEVTRVFGPEFTAALAAQPVGGWQGPVISGYGLHLVELREAVAGSVPALADVRQAVERDLLATRGAEAKKAFYATLRAHYSIRIEQGEEVAKQ